MTTKKLLERIEYLREVLSATMSVQEMSMINELVELELQAEELSTC